MQIRLMTEKSKKNRSKSISFIDELLSARRFRMTVPLNVQECREHLFAMRDETTEVDIEIVSGGYREFEIIVRSPKSSLAVFDGWVQGRAKGTLREEEAMGMTRIQGYVHLGFWPTTGFLIVTLIFLLVIIQSFVNNTLRELLDTDKIILILAYCFIR